ncbi:thiamine pyrophosphate-dependent enzyme [bacterium]|nr:thiamine pyrophosphate-dependent enzyme [bacterium]
MKKYLLHQLLSWYRALLTPRVIEERMLLLLKQGGISKWFSGIGQEAIAVGATSALAEDEYILPLHRNLGVFTTRGLPLDRLFSQFMGKERGYTSGRDRSFHFTSLEDHIVGMISHLGPHFCTALGLALAAKQRGQKKVVLAIGGDGMTSQGDFHEALNVASVWKLPVLFLIENNGYALSTPTSEQYACTHLSERSAAYGMPGERIDGNDFFAVFEVVSRLKKEMLRDPHPVLLECQTFRVRGHEEASGVKYVPPALIEEWQERDPLLRFEERLRQFPSVRDEDLREIRQEIAGEVERALERALSDSPPQVSQHREEQGVFAARRHPAVKPPSPKNEEKELRYVDAIREGLFQCMEEDPELLLMGQDVAEYGGVFKTSENFVERFGRERIRNTPLCESAIIGSTVGLALEKVPSVVELQFADFASTGFTQIVNNLAKMHYRTGEPMPVVLRMPCGAGVGAGPFHSQTNESWFLHAPGLKVAYPSSAADAKGMLVTSIRDPNPVMFFEHKLLYRRARAAVPSEIYETPPTAKLLSEGEDLTCITYGLGVHWMQEFAERHPELSITILDLRWLAPLDLPAIQNAVASTGRVLVCHEASTFGGFGGELSALIGEHCFSDLDAPVRRCGSLTTPVPFQRELEQAYLASARLEQTIEELLSY